MDAVVDLVENKSTIAHLSPLSFVSVFVLASALVMNGSALVGPDKLLPQVSRMAGGSVDGKHC